MNNRDIYKDYIWKWLEANNIGKDFMCLKGLTAVC